MNTDVATALTQDATSTTGFLGIGVASAVNSAFTSSSVTNTVTSISETSMSEVNESKHRIPLRIVHLPWEATLILVRSTICH